jgi:hypothetical protein
MHTFACATSGFFSPALPTCRWAFLVQELLSKILHVLAGLYSTKVCCVEIKLDTCVINNFFFG